MTRKSAIRHTTPANRGVFCDPGFDEAGAKMLEMRAELMAALREHSFRAHRVSSNPV
jgi:hypothetical protein